MAVHYLKISIILILLSAVVLRVTSEKVYIISPSEQECREQEDSGKQCLTLQQFVTGNYTTNFTSLQMLPGIHHIDLSNTTILVPTIYSLKVNGSDATILCNGNYFNFRMINRINIRGVRLMGCRETSFTSVRVLTIRDTNFEHHGPVILNSVLNATITNSLIINGRKLLVHSSTLIIKTTLFSNLTATDNYSEWNQDPHGGAMQTDNSNIIIEQCVFFNNSLHSLNSSCGGAVYANNTRLHITDSSFTGNFATEAGGAITAMDTLVQITKSQFRNNLAIEKGGVLYITGNYITVNISQSTFNRNKADVTGGTLYIEANMSTIFIDQCQFLNSRAKEGGTLKLTGNSTSIHISTSVFSNSRARVMGGALQILGDYVNFDVRQCYFSNNTAGTEGGAIYLKGYQSALFLNDSTFSNNLAARCAVLQAGYGQNVQFINSTVKNNIANGELTSDGTGGVACLKQTSVHVISSSFSLNKATGNAGVLYTENSSLSIVGSSFDGNKAGLNGGVIYWYAATPRVSINITYSRFSNNLAFIDGAVMYVSSSGSQANIRNSTFADNNATEGGATIAVFGSQLYLDQNIIFDNNYGWVINACRSNVTTASDDLIQIVEPNPNNSSCRLYDERQVMPMTTADMNTTETTEASSTGSTTEANTTPGITSSPKVTTTPAGTETTTIPGTNDTPSLATKPTAPDSSRTEDQSAMPTVPNFYATAIYTTLGIAIVVCVLLALLYIIVMCIVLYLCGVFKSKKRLVDNPYVYVPMKENETNADNEIAPQQ
jgi:predicted outer membrane repeat protein